MLVLAILLAFFISPLTSHAQSDEATMLEVAKFQYHDGNHYFASTWLERILKTYPRTARREEVLVMLSNSYAATGRDEKAVRTLQILLKDYPKAAATLDPSLLKLAGYLAPPEPSPDASGPPPADAEETAIASPAAEPVASPGESVPTAKEVPEPAASPQMPVAAPVASAAPAARAKTAATPAVARKSKEPPPWIPTLQNVLQQGRPSEVTSAPPAPVSKPAPAQVKSPAPLNIAAPPPAQGKKPAPPVPAQADVAAPPPVAAEPPPVAAEPAPVAAEPAVPVLKPAPAEAIAPATAAPVPGARPAPLIAESAEQCQKTDQADQADQAATYTVEIGEYVVKTALGDAKRRIEMAGVAPVVAPGPKRKEPMTRIYLGEFASQQAAKKTLDKLRSVNAENFVLTDKAGKLHIYAGSYFDQKSAAKEKQRFAALGIKSDLKQVVVSVPTFVLTAGCFRTREAAMGKVAELEQLGVKSVVIQKWCVCS